METITLQGRSISRSGIGEGEAMVSQQTFGFSHGVDPRTGNVCDEVHEWMGQNIKGKVLVFPYGKGSTSGGLWLLETARLGNAPAAIINLEIEPVLAAGFILAKLLYDKEVPAIDHLEQDPLKVIRTGDRVKVDGNTGIVLVTKNH